MKFDFKLVGKVGSMALINKERDDIDYNVIAKISRELAPGMIWVTSGATEIGRLDYIRRNGAELNGNRDQNKADYAAQGQSILMQTYRQYVNFKYSLRQVLVEHLHFNDEEKLDNLKKLFLRCPKQNAIPIVNYNDAVCYEENRRLEIQILKSQKNDVVQGVDNDETAARISTLVKAETLLILTSVEGIYQNPKDPSTLIKEIGGKDVYELIQNIDGAKAMCSGASREGANGASAKLEFIKEPAKLGTRVIIANSRYKISDILSGAVPRTLIATR